MKAEERVYEDGTKSIHTYDDAGLHIRTTDYDEAGNISMDIHYEFDDLQRVVGWKVLDSSGATVRRFENTYNPEGLQTEILEYGHNGNLIRREKFVYNDTVLVEEQQYDATGKLGSRKVYEYDEDGGILDSHYYDPQGNLLDGPAV